MTTRPDDGDAAVDADAGPGADADRQSPDDVSTWQFGLLGEEDADADAEESVGPVRPPIEPEPVSVENALFVLTGVVGTVWILVSAL
jgi:hypothetical protein